jgi:hypothetical protein
VYARVSLPALSGFLDRGRRDPEGSAQRLLEDAWNALLAANVIEWLDERGDPVTPPAGAQVSMEDGELSLRFGEGVVATWAPGRLPPWQGLVEALAYYLATTFNEPPIEGPWPKQFDR